MITFMGLAVGIDYSLFIGSRYREERRGGHDKLGAIEVAGSTANRAVLFNCMTVVLVVGMLIVPTKIFVSLGAGAILVVLVAVISASRCCRGAELLGRSCGVSGGCRSLAAAPRKRPRRMRILGRTGASWSCATASSLLWPSVALLLICAIPYLNINTAAGLSTLPTAACQAGYVAPQPRHARRGDPATIVVDGNVATPAAGQAFRKLRTDSAKTTSDRSHPRSRRLLTAAVIAAPLPVAGDPNSDVVSNAVRDLYRYRHRTSGRLNATGASAQNLDYFYKLTDKYTPIVFAFVLGLSFLLLMLVFRSIVVPAQIFVMNLLSVGAAYGLIVLVSQKGFGADILGFQQVDTVEAWLPLFLFSVLFGLSMDYHVFLLSRIRERYLRPATMPTP